MDQQSYPDDVRIMFTVAHLDQQSYPDDVRIMFTVAHLDKQSYTYGTMSQLDKNSTYRHNVENVMQPSHYVPNGLTLILPR